MAPAAKKGAASKVAVPIVKKKAKSDLATKKVEKTAPAKVVEQKTASKETAKAAAPKPAEKKAEREQKKTSTETAKAAAPKPAEKKAEREQKTASTAKAAAPKPAEKKAAAVKKDAAQAAPKEGQRKGGGSTGKQRTMAKRLEEAQAAVEKDGKKPAESSNDQPRGVIYLAHIPVGFFEPQMRKFFSQFGQVTRMRLSRSKKNGALKGFGWVEFLEHDVAKVVQQTMNGYLLFGKKLKCEIVPKEKQHPALFKGCRKRMVNREGARRGQFKRTYNNRPTAQVEGEVLPRETTRQHARRGKSTKKLSSKLAALGVTFDLESVLDGAGKGENIDIASAPKKVQVNKRQEDPAAAKKAKKAKRKAAKAAKKAKGSKQQEDPAPKSVAKKTNESKRQADAAAGPKSKKQKKG